MLNLARPLILLAVCWGLGWAGGGGLAGALYHYWVYSAPAWAAGLAANAVNLVIVGALVLRQQQQRVASSE